MKKNIYIVQKNNKENLLTQKKDQKLESTTSSTTEDYNKILELKGIKQFIDKIDSKTVRSRLCMGFLSKKGKNNITRYQRRFFILVSAKSLNPSFQDDFILSEDKLPPWLELETIYYFQFRSNEDSSPFIGKISLRNCISITIEDNQHKNILENLKQDFIDFSSNIRFMKEIFSREMGLGLTKPEHGFGFTLCTTERTYYFYSDLITEMNKWIIAIEQSVKNYKEMHPDAFKPNIKILDVSPRKTMSTKGLKQIQNEDEIKEENEGFPEEKIVSSSESSKNKSNNFAKEGYLFKKTLNKLRKIIGWKQRYVCLNGGIFFWVNSNVQKENPKTIYSVNIIEKCTLHKEDQFILVSQ